MGWDGEKGQGAGKEWMDGWMDGEKERRREGKGIVTVKVETDRIGRCV